MEARPGPAVVFGVRTQAAAFGLVGVGHATERVGPTLRPDTGRACSSPEVPLRRPTGSSLPGWKKADVLRRLGCEAFIVRSRLLDVMPVSADSRDGWLVALQVGTSSNTNGRTDQHFFASQRQDQGLVRIVDAFGVTSMPEILRENT